MRAFGWVEVHAVDHCNNNCLGCHNFSPTAPKRVFAAEEYFDGLDRMERAGLHYEILSIMGGEPFLHPDLTGFVATLRRRYRHEVLITTNRFWLDEPEPAVWDDLLRVTDHLFLSAYPNMVHRLGGQEAYNAKLRALKRRHPHLNLRVNDKFRFRTLRFTREPRPVGDWCGNAECMALLPDSRLGRCGPGAYAHLCPEAAEAFSGTQHLFYDLKRFDPASFWLWRKRYPLDACEHCSLWRGEFTGWKVRRGVDNRGRELDYHLAAARRLLALGATDRALVRCLEAGEAYGESRDSVRLLADIWRRLGNRVRAEGLDRRAETLARG